MGDCSTGALTLGGGTVTFTEGATITLANGASMTISDAVVITVNMSDEDYTALLGGDAYELFKGDYTQDVLDNAKVTFVSASGDLATARVDQTAGSVTIKQLVPEPTTATLSLLALAALAARRRRK